ncbi:DUF6063 family protein [Cytobacillus gottheilii]|uniref:Non-ribosomal peptide synthetase module n=1 Tax=Cytobacillus gottheilii TaxID=859144 RepID=A0ABX8FHJ3_9BACI|nr:DUF6063 family protein [Cytobacillus gottheilii]QVY63492.1 non-ribosomal peptide synthetase module [Cytobacillus gottheilii]
MTYSEGKVMLAFEIYSLLSRDGRAGAEQMALYKADDSVRGLIDRFAHHVDCVIILAGDQMCMIPETKLSPFHVNNDFLKRTYLKSGATNADIYLLYFTVIVLFGSFYDSYQTLEPTREFIRLDDWTLLVNDRILMLMEHDEEKLLQHEKEFSYNWKQIIDKWDDMNDIKESAKKQSGNTISRLSFMDTAKRFVIDQELLEEIGNNELILTEKAKTIVQRFFMEVEYNKGILEFIYQWEEDHDAIHQ